MTSKIDFAGVNVGDKILDGFGLIDWIGIDRIGVEHGLADVAEALIDVVSRWRGRREADDRRLSPRLSPHALPDLPRVT